MSIIGLVLQPKPLDDQAAGGFDGVDVLPRAIEAEVPADGLLVVGGQFGKELDLAHRQSELVRVSLSSPFVHRAAFL